VTTTPPEQETLRATEIKCIFTPAVVSYDSTSNTNHDWDQLFLRVIQDSHY
jgi:hypothetical protein